MKFSLLLAAAFVVHEGRGSREHLAKVEIATSTGTCNCACCTAPAEKPAEPVCVLARGQARPPSEGHTCGELCQRSTGKGANGTGIEHDTFCRIECAPGTGVVCEWRLGKVLLLERSAVAGLMNASSAAMTVAVDAATTQTRQSPRKHRGSVALLEVGSTRARAPWDILSGDPSAIGFRAETEANAAFHHSEAAVEDSDSSQTIAAKNKNIIPSIVSSVEASVQSARNAYAAETFTDNLLQETKKAVADRAHEAIDGILNQVRDEALAKAKEEAEVRAMAMMKKMLASAPEAAAKAAEPYAAAEAMAANYADQYEALADKFVGKSQAIQMDSQTLLAQAQSWNSLGETGKAQADLKQSHFLMEKAVGWNAKASGFYSAAESILSHEDEYKDEAKMAEYHAMVMHDPDAEPPIADTPDLV